MTSEHQRKLGAFYTPHQVTHCLSRWAIRTKKDVILEPSFGGCNFLTSSIEVLSELGANHPYEHIFGFDIDTTAFEILKKKELDSSNFIFGDFLKFNDLDVINPVDVVLGNPPYVRVHKLQESYKNYLFAKFNTGEIKIPKRSGLWIYFVIHALKFLAPSGRMAWVLPDSLAFTDYGKIFLKQISRLFKSIMIVRIEERYFKKVGTSEKTVFLLCENFRQGTCQPKEIRFKLLTEALAFVSGVTSIRPYTVTDNIPDTLKTLSNFRLTTLGELFEIRIGIVIGATDLLVFSKEKALSTPYYPNFVYPVITKGKQLSGIVINKELLSNNSKKTPYLLLDAINLETERPALFEQLIKEIPETVLLNQTFKKRKQLFGYDDFHHPDAFLTFFSQGLPKLVINENKELNSTNSVHRLYAKAPMDTYILKFLAIQLFAEVFADSIQSLARPYGNAIKKFEPSDAKKIPLLVPIDINEELRNAIDFIMKTIRFNVDRNKLAAAKKIASIWINQMLKN